MTVKELKEWAKKEGCTNIEYYRYRDERCHLIHTDTVVSYDDEIKDNYEIIDWAFVDSADEYNRLLNSNSCDDANEWWEDGDKYLLGVLVWDFYNGCPVEN